jgi:hypothetical protein
MHAGTSTIDGLIRTIKWLCVNGCDENVWHALRWRLD